MAQYLGETKTWMSSGLHTSLKKDDYASGQLYPPHCNNCYEILFVAKGSVRFDMEGEQITLKENNAIVIAPMVYQIVTGNDDAYHRIILFFDLPTVPEGVRNEFASQVGKRYTCSSPELIRLFQSYLQLKEDDNPQFDELSNAIFTMILYIIAYDKSIDKNSQISAKKEKLRLITNRLDQNLTGEVQIREIAKELHVSESSVYRLFKEEMKIPLKQYVLKKKMIYAETLLRQGMSPGDVAQTCGYKNYASFYKVFVKLTGKRPGKVV